MLSPLIRYRVAIRRAIGIALVTIRTIVVGVIVRLIFEAIDSRR